MSHFATMKRLIDMGLPDRWVIPVMEALEMAETPMRKKRRKRRTKEQIAADAALTRKKSARKTKKI